MSKTMTRATRGNDMVVFVAGVRVYTKKTVLLALAMSFFMGAFVMNTVVLCRHVSSGYNNEGAEAMMLAPFLQQHQQQQNIALPVTAASSSYLTSRIQEIDCETHHAKADPNAGMSEDSTMKFVNQTDPNFWISLHKDSFDPFRWSSIYRGGNYYETGITDQFREILKDAQPRGVVVDVGMNIGWFTLYSRAMGHKVVAFDPNPIMHSRVCTSLKYNRWWNGSDDNNPSSSSSSGVTTFAYGLGDQVGSFVLTLGENPGGSSFLRTRVGRKAGQIHVPVTTLDLVATQMGWLQNDEQQQEIIHLLKIDTEGFESYIVRGGARLIGSGLVRNVLVESMPDKQNGSPTKILDQFSFFWNSGFAVERITNASGKKIRDADQHAERINRQLQRQEFEGSDSHKLFAKKGCNIWWKQKADVAVAT